MPKFRKEILRVGTYWAQGPAPVKVSHKDLVSYHRNFSKMKRSGLSVPVLWEHPDLTDPEGDPRQDRAEMAKNTIGFLDSVEVKGDRIYGTFDAPIPEDASRLKAHRFVSPKIAKAWQDGQGQSWNDIISHVAVTPIPVQASQEPFEQIPDISSDAWAASAVVLSLANKAKPRSTNFSKWTKYVGPRGGRGWQNTQTGKVIYEAEPPGERHGDPNKMGLKPGSRQAKQAEQAQLRRAKHAGGMDKLEAQEREINTEESLRYQQHTLKQFIAQARKKLGPELSNKIARQGAGKGGQVTLTPEEVGKVLTDGVVGFVSAGRNPNSDQDKNLSDEAIDQRDAKLQSRLKELGYRFVKVRGKYGEVEDSYMVMVPEASKSELTKLGKEFNQDSILYSKANKNELIFTTGENAGKAFKGSGWDAVPDADDFFTEYISADGDKVKFVLGLNFDTGPERSRLFSLKQGEKDMPPGKGYDEDEKVEAKAEEKTEDDGDTEDTLESEDTVEVDEDVFMEETAMGYPSLTEVVDALSSFSPPIVIPQEGTDESNFIERLWVAVTAAKAASTGEVPEADTGLEETEEFDVEEVPQVAALSKSLKAQQSRNAIMLSHMTRSVKDSLQERINNLYRKMVISKTTKQEWLEELGQFQLSFSKEGVNKSPLETRIEDHEKLRPGAALEAGDPRLETLLSHATKEVPLPGDLMPEEQGDTYLVDQFLKQTGLRK